MAKLLAEENERLIAKVLELQKRLAVAEGRDKKQLELELASLQKELEKRTEKVFKHASEKRPHGDGDAGDAADGEEPKKPGHGPREQQQLRIEDVVHELDEADRICPCSAAAAALRRRDDVAGAPEGDGGRRLEVAPADRGVGAGRLLRDPRQPRHHRREVDPARLRGPT